MRCLKAHARLERDWALEPTIRSPVYVLQKRVLHAGKEEAEQDLRRERRYRMSPGGEEGVKAAFLGREPQLLETMHLSLGEGLEGKVGEWRPTPEFERLVEPRCGGSWTRA